MIMAFAPPTARSLAGPCARGDRRGWVIPAAVDEQRALLDGEPVLRHAECQLRAWTRVAPSSGVNVPLAGVFPRGANSDVLPSAATCWSSARPTAATRDTPRPSPRAPSIVAEGQASGTGVARRAGRARVTDSGAAPSMRCGGRSRGFGAGMDAASDSAKAGDLALRRQSQDAAGPRPNSVTATSSLAGYDDGGGSSRWVMTRHTATDLRCCKRWPNGKARDRAGACGPRRAGRGSARPSKGGLLYVGDMGGASCVKPPTAPVEARTGAPSGAAFLSPGTGVSGQLDGIRPCSARRRKEVIADRVESALYARPALVGDTLTSRPPAMYCTRSAAPRRLRPARE